MSKQKRGLGKGLGALIPQEDEKVQSVSDISIDDIQPNKEQPRRNFDQTSLLALADSIQEYGVVQPIVLRQKGTGYQIVAGERRWRAAKHAGLKTIPAVVKDIDEVTQAKVALIENLQREDLSPVEEANAYAALINEYQLTQELVAKSVGKSRTYVTNTLRLLKLDENILDMISKGLISGGHGRALLMIDDVDQRIKVATEIIAKALSVRQVEKIAAETKKNRQLNTLQKEEVPEIQMYESKLKGYFGTKVNIKNGKKKGKIEIEYYGDDDLNRILSLIDLL